MSERSSPGFQLDLADVTREVLASAAAAAQARGLSLTIELHPAPMHGDAERLGEAVRNLVHNAIEYNRPNGSVRVSTVQADRVVRLEVRDTGIGVDAAELPRIFDRFYRADTSRSRAAGGSGLGLAIVKWIVEEHGGRIECRSDSTGTTFTSTFPAEA